MLAFLIFLKKNLHVFVSVVWQNLRLLLISDCVFRIDVETALVAVQLELGVNSRLFDNPSKIADFVGQVAKAVAEKPFKYDIN